MPRFFLFSRRDKAYQGSAVLASAVARAVRVLLAVAFLWALTGWALQWW